MEVRSSSAIRVRLGQVLAVAGLLLFATVAFLSGTDRQSREFLTTPSFLGWPYDTGAARARAIDAIVKHGPSSAMGYAKRAIVSDPLSADAVSILGRSQLFSGKLAEAHATFEVAGQLGWRDALTQVYWLDQAMQEGNLKVASERLDALLRQNPDNENRDRFLALLSSSPEGRAALAERLRISPVWVQPYVSELDDVPQDQLLQRIDVMARVGNGVWDCSAVTRMTQKLIDLNMLPEAMSVWRRSCTESNSLVYDGGFDKLDTTKATGGFEWQLSGRGDIDVQATADQTGNRRLQFEVTAARSLPILRQLIVLEPGTYRLSWRTPDTDAPSARQLSVSLSCKPDLADAVPGTLLQGTKDVYVQDFKLDAACTAWQLNFWLAPRVEIFLDDVTLQKK